MTNKLNEILAAQIEMFQEVVAENLVGIDFVSLYKQSCMLELVRMSEELGLYNIN